MIYDFLFLFFQNFFFMVFNYLSPKINKKYKDPESGGTKNLKKYKCIYCKKVLLSRAPSASLVP